MARPQDNAVLIVSQDTTLVAQVRRVLGRLPQTRIELRATPEEAIRLLKDPSHTFQLVVVSVQPGQVNQTLEDLAHCTDASHAGKASPMPVIAIIDTQSRDDLKSLRSIGYAHILLKPLNDSLLEQHLVELSRQSGTGPSPQRTENLLKIRDALKVGDVTQAENLLNICLRKNPDAVEFLTLYAELLYRRGSLIKGEEVILRALQMQPNFIPALHICCKILLKSGDIRKAIACIKKRLKAEQQEKDSQEKFLGGEVLSSSVHAGLEGGLVEVENLPVILNNHGLLLTRKGNFPDAILLYLTALTVPNATSIAYLLHFNLAVAYQRTGDWDTALQHVRFSKQLAPAGFIQARELEKRIESEPRPEPKVALDSTQPVSEATKLPVQRNLEAKLEAKLQSSSILPSLAALPKTFEAPVSAAASAQASPSALAAPDEPADIDSIFSMQLEGEAEGAHASVPGMEGQEHGLSNQNAPPDVSFADPLGPLDPNVPLTPEEQAARDKLLFIMFEREKF